MKRALKKLVLGSHKVEPEKATGIINKRLQNIQGIWNNDHHNDVGIEKLFRLFLALSQFAFPGLYIKHYFGKQGSNIQDVAMDIYILFKVLLPLMLLYSTSLYSPYLLALIIWLLLETLLYVPTLIFASDFFARPSSYRRSMLMLFLNYLEISFAYGFIYSTGNYLNMPLVNWYDSIYFSMTTLSSIGLGDLYPVTGVGKFLVSSQSLIFLMFVVVFINFFVNKVESRGYFEK